MNALPPHLDRARFRAFEEAPRNWGPPRGTANSLWARRDFGSDAEMVAVEIYRAIVRQLDRSRGARSVRALAEEAGVAPSSVQCILSGSAWTRWATLEAVARALGFELAVVGWPGLNVPAAIRESVRHRPSGDVVGTAVSDGAFVMPNTFFELTSRSPNARTVLAFLSAEGMDLRVELVPIREAVAPRLSPVHEGTREAELLKELAAVLDLGLEGAHGRTRAALLRARSLATQLGAPRSSHELRGELARGLSGRE